MCANSKKNRPELTDDSDAGGRKPDRFQLPHSLESKLASYRHRVWWTKVSEAIAICACCILLAWAIVFVLDRFFDTPRWLRTGAFALAAFGLALVPSDLYRWVWRRRTLAQTARLICRRLPGPGDRLLGVLDLVADEREQLNSPVLCEAAIEQVAIESSQWDLKAGLPPSRGKLHWYQAATLFAILAVVGFFTPAAVRSGWLRMVSPWGDEDRYTFASVGRLDATHIVPHGEPFSLSVSLADDSRWRPKNARLHVGLQPVVTAELDDREYEFNVPAQIDASDMRLKIGDARHTVRLEPTQRPELESVTATVTLPEYLERQESLTLDARGGALALVRGSKLTLQSTINRKLASATVNGQERSVSGTTFESESFAVEANNEFVLTWEDRLGLGGKEPFTILLTAEDDHAPTVSCNGLRRQMVVLVTEQLKFQFQGRDDFGVRDVGIRWQGFEYNGTESDTSGIQVLAAGGPDRETLNASGTFQADSLGITPQAIELQLYVNDYYPDRDPVLSAPIMIYVLSPDDHAIWLTEQLSKWHRRALEVRDRELKLYAENNRLRALSEDDLDTPETRTQIERQAAAEKNNGRRLAKLTGMGEEIIQQAMKNPEFGVGHLEKWAEMLQVLKDISVNRMPSVADLLKDAAEAPQLARSEPNTAGPTAGKNRTPTKPASGEQRDKKTGPAVPQIVDGESSEQQFDDELANGKPQDSKSGKPVLGLPVTTLAGKPSEAEACAAQPAMENAVEEQEDLLAEFEKVADELNNILANLEGSTLVKRLKAASRKQFQISKTIGGLVELAFGNKQEPKELLPIVQDEVFAASNVSYIMDDMQAYFDRRPFARFKTVLDEMRATDVLGSIRQLSDDIPKTSGVSMAQCEFWGDSMDRWAEDLVDPAGGGT